MTLEFGTWWYMAPEMFEDVEYGVAVDIWALGVTWLDMHHAFDHNVTRRILQVVSEAGAGETPKTASK